MIEYGLTHCATTVVELAARQHANQRRFAAVDVAGDGDAHVDVVVVAKLAHQHPQTAAFRANRRGDFRRFGFQNFRHTRERVEALVELLLGQALSRYIFFFFLRNPANFSKKSKRGATTATTAKRARNGTTTATTCLPATLRCRARQSHRWLPHCPRRDATSSATRVRRTSLATALCAHANTEIDNRTILPNNVPNSCSLYSVFPSSTSRPFSCSSWACRSASHFRVNAKR